jgi:hypothetical protein
LIAEREGEWRIEGSRLLFSFHHSLLAIRESRLRDLARPRARGLLEFLSPPVKESARWQVTKISAVPVSEHIDFFERLVITQAELLGVAHRKSLCFDGPFLGTSDSRDQIAKSVVPIKLIKMATGLLRRHLRAHISKRLSEQ